MTRVPAAEGEQLLRERLEGHSLRQIGDRHDLTPEGVRGIVAREAERQIDELAKRLRANRGTDQLECFVIPSHNSGPDFDLAVDAPAPVQRTLW